MNQSRTLGVLLVALVVGCSHATEPRSQAPELPPVSSMRIDLSLFEGQPKPSGTAEQETKLNFHNAAVRAAYVNDVGSDGEGDELRYRAEGSLRSIEFADASTGEDWDIIRNEADGSGSLRVPDYRNGQRSCWDANQEDVECPAGAGNFLAGVDSN